MMVGIQYASDQRLKETTQYEFSEKDIKLKGESFETTFDWNNLYKIKLLKGWLFLYQNKLVVNFVNMDGVNTEDQKGLADFIVKQSKRNNSVA
ncbi:MAG: YcxB family protein [Flavobacterium sp.]|nr:MAG: YcxB family protein [Flavobacterium sp.]